MEASPILPNDPVDGTVRAFLTEDFARIDRGLPALVRLLDERGAAENWHKHGTFKEHLLGVYRMLRLWRQPEDVCVCGLFHSVYSNEFVDLALFDPKEGRDVLRRLVGPQTEALIHLFCVMPRAQFTLDLLSAETAPREGMRLRGGDGTEVVLSGREAAAFLVVSLADFAEQWFGWQDEIMAGFPSVGKLPAKQHWAAALWPGTCHPSTASLTLVSRLARLMPEMDLPVPPVFEHCTAVLTAEDQAAAAALYWQVATHGGPQVPAAQAMARLRAAIRLNPFVAEPHLLLAQLHLLDGEFEAAEQHALAGLRLLCGWGTPWDKRVGWAGWIAWARLLLRKARLRTWPQTLREHNNLGLVVA